MTRMKSPPMTPAAIRGVLPTEMGKERKRSMKREKTEEEREQLYKTLFTYHESGQFQEMQIKMH